jgi:hypothetical protein
MGNIIILAIGSVAALNQELGHPRVEFSMISP